MNKHIFIVNGKPTSGKTTFEEMVLKKISGSKYSIIDPAKELLIKNNLWDGITKNNKIRKFLSDIKIALDDYCDYSFGKVASKVIDFNKNDTESVLFIDMREKKDIDRAVKNFGATTIYIENNNISNNISNIADDFGSNVKNYNYDVVIDNSNDLPAFEKKASDFVNVLINYGGCNEKV